VVLIAAVRGWLKGFLSQAISLSAMIACVYIASPMRDAARPHARHYLPAMHAGVLDRLLWWGGAVVGFIALSGLGHYLLRFRRRQPYGLSEPNRANQGAGFVFGAAKGAMVAAFMAAGFAQFSPKYIAEDGAIAEHAKRSRSLAWNAEYQPAERIWRSAPVQAFVAHVRANGLGDVSGPGGAAPAADESATVQAPAPASEARDGAQPSKHTEPVKTARRTPESRVPRERPLDPQSPTFLDDVARDMKRLGIGEMKSR
jgi:hypothetical protein